MKIDKLFKKAEKFFGMDKDEQKKNIEKKEKLLAALEEKILSMKVTIKSTENIEKKENLKKELDVLQKLKEKLKDKN